MKLMILGTGGMARSHVNAFQAIDKVNVVACADISMGAARAFADEHNIARAYGSLEEAIAAGGFDAAANVTPDGVHHATTLKLLDAGIHVFCEKPLATNYGDAQEMAAAADTLVNGVNLTYRNVSALQMARSVIGQGRLGNIRHLEASYLQSWLTQPAWGDWKTEDQWLWRLSKSHGSHGVLGDVGIHILDFASFAIGSSVSALTCQLKTFDKAPGNRIGSYTLDANDSATLTTEFANGALGVVHASRFASGHLNDLTLKIFGDKGGLEVTNKGDLGTLRICEGDNLLTATWKDLQLSKVDTTYQRFANAVAGGERMDPDFATAADLQAVIDAAVLADQSGGKLEIHV